MPDRIVPAIEAALTTSSPSARSSSPAPAMAGIDRRKENRVASSRLRPARSPAPIVAPDRRDRADDQEADDAAGGGRVLTLAQQAERQADELGPEVDQQRHQRAH